jgi:hypothetical protein
MSFLVPSAHIRIEGPPGVSSDEPNTFRLQGLVTLLTAYALRFPVGCFSNRQRSWDSPLRSLTTHQGSRRFRLDEPTYRFSCRCSHRRSSGPAQQAAVPGFHLGRGSTRRQTGLVPPPRETPLGFLLPGCFTKALIRISPDLLSHASAVNPQAASPARRPRVSIDLRFVHPRTATSRGRRANNPLRVSAPARS